MLDPSSRLLAVLVLGLWLSAAAAAASGSAGAAWSGPPAEAVYLPGGTILIRNIRVIDGLGNPPREHRDVLVEDGRIVRIAPGNSLHAPPDAHRIDGEGRTLLPGLIDGHSHLLHDSLGGRFDVLRPWRPLLANLYAGVTTVSDMGSQLETATALRDAVASGSLAGPAVHTVGDFFEEGSERERFLAPRTLARMEDYGALLDLHRAHGVSLVKAYVMMPLVRLQQLSSMARERQMRVTVDAGAWNGTEAYLRAGVDGFAHVAFTHPLSPQEISAARERGTWAIGTAAIVHQLHPRTNRLLDEGPGVLDQPLVRDVYTRAELQPACSAAAVNGMLDDFRRAAGQAYGAAFFEGFDDWPGIVLRNIRALLDAGVLVGLGTDPLFPGLSHGEAIHHEMALWSQAGIPNLEILHSATHRNALILGIDGDVGAVRTGMAADLLVVDGNPAEDISHTRRIVSVIRRGRLVDRTALRRAPDSDDGRPICAAVAPGSLS